MENSWCIDAVNRHGTIKEVYASEYFIKMDPPFEAFPIGIYELEEHLITEKTKELI
jgi:hypothetical protein